MNTTRQLQEIAVSNPAIGQIWRAWHTLDLPDCWLVAGCLAQSVWNAQFGLPALHGLSDIDLIYFDETDLTEAAEQGHADRIRALFPALGVWIDVKNEARVHLWYEAKFGYPIAPYRSATDAIDTFPTTATAIGLRPSDSGAEVHAPFGLWDLFDGVVRPNKRQITREIYYAKVKRWRVHWPHLHIIDWTSP